METLTMIIASPYTWIVATISLLVLVILRDKSFPSGKNTSVKTEDLRQLTNIVEEVYLHLGKVETSSIELDARYNKLAKKYDLLLDEHESLKTVHKYTLEELTELREDYQRLLDHIREVDQDTNGSIDS